MDGGIAVNHHQPEEIATDRQQSELDFSLLYETYWTRIHRYVERLLQGQGGDAEDITQEVFLKVAANLDSFRQDAKISTWIYRIATNAVRDRLRKNGHGPVLDPRTMELIENGETLRTDRIWGEGRRLSQPEGRVVHREMNCCIRKVIDELPEKYRVAIVLSEMEGLKNKEIANVLAISLDNVKVRLHRGRVLLRQALAGRCDFYWDERNELVCEEKEPSSVSKK